MFTIECNMMQYNRIVLYCQVNVDLILVSSVVRSLVQRYGPDQSAGRHCPWSSCEVHVFLQLHENTTSNDLSLVPAQRESY